MVFSKEPDYQLSVELQQLIEKVKSGNKAALKDIQFMFLPTGPVQELSIDNGWGDEYMKLASLVDDACAQSLNEPW